MLYLIIKFTKLVYVDHSVPQFKNNDLNPRAFISYSKSGRILRKRFYLFAVMLNYYNINIFIFVTK